MAPRVKVGVLASAAAIAVSALMAAPAEAAPRIVNVGSQAAFTNTSGTIVCALRDGHVRCDVSNPRFTPPRKPRDCDLDWGDSVFLSRRGNFGCHGDTVNGTANLRTEATRWFSHRNGVPAPPAYRGGPRQAGLPPGIALRSGHLVCTTSTKQAVTCTNMKTKHGFTVSRTSYRIR